MSHEIAIYQNIGSGPDEFGPDTLRKELAQAAGQPVTIRLNSEGGNVIDGLAIYNLLQQHHGQVTVVIDGMALSIASLIACGADKVQMAENAWFMVHNPHNQVAGDGDDLRDMAGLLDGMRDQLATVYSAKSKKPKDEILQLMDAETWMTGPQALEAGFVDEVTASLAMAAEFDASRFRNAPRQSKIPATFQAHVELQVATGKSRTEAVRSVVLQHPDLHRQFVRAANANHPHALARMQ